MPATHPSEEDREWLERELAALLARVGSERFVLGPILEPSDRFFPDPYVAGPRGVRTVARRLLHWAGLPEVGVEVLDESPREDARRIPTWEIELEGVEPGYVTLGLIERGKPERLPGALTPLLAAAIRSHLRLDVEPGGDPYRSVDVENDPELEVELSSVTAVQLGWGVLALDAAQRHDSAGEVVGSWHAYEVATEEHGGLSIADLAYLVAAQLVVRGVSEAERARIAALLPPNQASLLREWCDALERDALIARLGIAGADDARPRPHVVPEPLADDEDEDSEDSDEDSDDESDESDDDESEGGWNGEGAVFRVPDVSSAVFAGGGAAAGVVGGFALAALGVAASYAVGVGGALGAIAGVLIARRVAGDACSDPSCEAPLPADAARCPRCRGHIAGRIAKRAGRLEAEEALGAAWYRERGLPLPASIPDDGAL